jgi:Histidine kinase-, DNA gyrase B-, and HSP90-like ATPase
VAAYYVVSEALTNAAKHAHASAIHVDAEAAGRRLRLSVRDDGAGGADPARGSGLVGLKDRVEALGGTITIDSPAGAGTSLHAELPLPANGQARQPRPLPAARAASDQFEAVAGDVEAVGLSRRLYGFRERCLEARRRAGIQHQAAVGADHVMVVRPAELLGQLEAAEFIGPADARDHSRLTQYRQVPVRGRGRQAGCCAQELADGGRPAEAGERLDHHAACRGVVLPTGRQDPRYPLVKVMIPAVDGRAHVTSLLQVD